MARGLLAPDYIFESSWEVCNKVGGIYTVLSTRAKTLQEAFRDKIIFIGRAVPYLAREALDRGMEVALLRDFLYDGDTRRLALEGASVIDTFSSWLTEPRHIAYEEIREGKCILRMMDY